MTICTNKKIKLKDMKRSILLCLFLFSFIFARPSIEFDRDRIESGSDFELRLVVPTQELQSDREVPSLKTTNGFILNSIDSVDTKIQRDFFSSFFGSSTPIPVRKYIFKLKAPSKTGSQIIGSLHWTIAGQEHTLSPELPVTLERPYSAPGLTVSLSPSKKTLYEGEQFFVTFKINTFENFHGNISFAGADLGNDFIVHRADLKDFKLNPSNPFDSKMEGSTTFAWLSPVKSGDLKIPPLQINYTKVGEPKIVEKTQSKGNFTSSFRSVVQEPIESIAKSSPIQLQVLPLPNKLKPTDFTGMVGDYSFSADFDKHHLKIGEALTLNIQIKGDGKPGTITDPILPDFSDFRSVPPENSITKRIQKNKVITSKNIKIFLYPKKQGLFKISPISYNWFNPNKRAYESVTAGPWEIEVEKGNEAIIHSPIMSSTPTASKKEIEELGQDIRFIRTDNIAIKPYTLFYKSWVFWLLLFSPFLFYFIASSFILKHRKKISNKALIRKSQANKNLNLNLKKANELIHQDSDSKDFYASLEKTLITYISDLTNLEFQGMTLLQVRTELLQFNLDETLVDQVQDALESYSTARFSHTSALDLDHKKQALKSLKTLCSNLELLK